MSTIYNPLQNPEEKKLILAVGDLSDYISIVKEKTPLEVFQFLDEFYWHLEEKIKDSGGRIVKYMGDAVLMVFPPNDEGAILSHLKKIKEEIENYLVKKSIPAFLQVKVHIGVVACGNIGYESNRSFDIIGKVVNELFLLPNGEFVVSRELQNLIELNS